MKKAALIVCSLLSFSTALAQSEGRTAYDFLRLPVSAHAAALGGDNITLIEDDAALIFNSPALLSSVSDKTIGLNYMNYMSGAYTASATFSRTIGERASWAASAQYLDYGKMKEADENNVITGEFSARDISVGGYFSYMLTDYLAGGIAAKMILSYIGEYHSVGFGVDLGLNYYQPDTEWSISAVVKNLGGQLKAYDENFEKMPIDVQIGVSKRFVGTPLRLHATLVDLNHLNYKFADHWVMGADMLLTESFWIGGGYNFRRAHEMRIASSDGKKSSHGAGLSLGAGLNLSRLKINVAYGKYHVSSSSVVLSLGYSL
jgi:hypothetical protein